MPPIGDILSYFAIAGGLVCAGRYACKNYHLWHSTKWDGKHPADIPELNKSREAMAERMRKFGVDAVVPKLK